MLRRIERFPPHDSEACRTPQADAEIGFGPNDRGRTDPFLSRRRNLPRKQSRPWRIRIQCFGDNHRPAPGGIVVSGFRPSVLLLREINFAESVPLMLARHLGHPSWRSPDLPIRIRGGHGEHPFPCSISSSAINPRPLHLACHDIGRTEIVGDDGQHIPTLRQRGVTSISS